MFKCVTKELKKRIFKGIDKIDSSYDDILDDRMKFKMELEIGIFIMMGG